MAASLAFEAVDTDTNAIGSGSTHTFSLTVASAAGQERLVAVGGIAADSVPPDYSSVTIDGQTATRVGTISHGASGAGAVAFVTFYRAPGTSGTSINVVATYTAFGATCFGGACALWTLNDADTLTATTNSAANDPTLSTNTSAGGVAAAALLGFDSIGGTAGWTGLTEDAELAIFTNDRFTAASANTATAETPRAISVDVNPNFNASVASICVTFAPVAGGAIPAIMHSYRTRRNS